jgi:hypothetical protein
MAARRLWEQATSGGAAANGLLQLLSDHMNQRDQPDIGLLAVPDPQSLAAAQQKLQPRLQTDLHGARTSQRQAELVKRWLEQADQAENSAERYAMFREALQLAAKLGSPVLVCRAVDEAAQCFQIDPLAMKAEGLGKIDLETNPVTARVVARSALDLLDGALAKSQLEAADQLSRIGLGAAAASHDEALVKKAEQQRRQVEQLVERAPEQPE